MRCKLNNTEKTLLHIRIKQFRRAIKDIGWGVLILLLPILCIAFFWLLSKLHNMSSTYLAFLYPMIAFVIHSSRKDFAFLKKLSVSLPLTILLEYSVATLPLTLTYTAMGQYSSIILGYVMLLPFCFILPWNYPKLSGSMLSLTLIPNSLFEWKSTIRHMHFGFLLIWVLGAFTSQNFYAYFFFVFIFATFISSTFKPTEAKELKPDSFDKLLIKIGINSSFLLTILFPHMILYLIFNYNDMYFLLGIVLYLLLIQIFCIAYKYSIYSQYRDTPNTIPTMIFLFVCPFIMVSIPYTLFIIQKAKKRLQYA